MVLRTKKKKVIVGGDSSGPAAFLKYLTANVSPSESHPKLSTFLLSLNPSQWLYWVVFQQGAKAIANYKLFTRILKSYKMTKDKYKNEYNALSETEKDDFLYASILIKSHYNERIGNTFEVIKPSQDIMESCDDIESLDTQYRLMKSKHYKDAADFNIIFKQNNPNKFKYLYENMKTEAAKSIETEQRDAVEKLAKEKEKSYLFRKTAKIQKQNDKLGVESEKMNENIITLERAQQLIEKLFVLNVNGKEVNYSYMIPYILHDIYKGTYIPSKVKDIRYLHKSDCSSVNSLWTSVKAKYLNPMEKYDVSKKSEVKIGGYSRRRAPKNKIPTIKRLKVTR